MSWPSVSFRSELPEVVRLELDALCALLRGHLSAEHASSGEHTNVSLIDVLFRTYGSRIYEISPGVLAVSLPTMPGGAIDPDVNAFSIRSQGAARELVRIGRLSVPGLSVSDNPAIRWAQPTDGLGEAWAIIARRDSFDDSLTWVDTTNGIAVMALYRKGTGEYALCKSNSFVGTSVDLGTAASALRFNNIYGGILHAMTQIFERSRTTALGEWIPITFAAGNFTGNGSMTWTLDSADQVRLGYTLIGKTAHLEFRLNNTSIGGVVNNELRLALPFSVDAPNITQPVYINHNGSRFYGLATASGSTLVFNRPDISNFAASTNDTELRGSLTFSIP